MRYKYTLSWHNLGESVLYVNNLKRRDILSSTSKFHKKIKYFNIKPDKSDH
jgi:hypothetical protein